MNMIDRDEYIQDYRRITSSVHAHGAPIIMQLAHAGRQTKASITGCQPVAPSALRDKMFPGDKPRELTEREILDLIDKFVIAIERAKLSGFDGVQLHAAHGYLLSQFLSPYMNRRTDDWGGNTQNRFRIVGEILRKARERVGDYTILAKINGHDARRNGMTVEEAVKISRLLEEAGCDAIEVSCGVGEDGFNTIRVRSRPVDAMLALVPDLRGLPRIGKAAIKLLAPLLFKEYKPIWNYNTSAAAQIKASVKIPVIVVGGTRSLAGIEWIIAAKQADYVAMARPFIIEPDIVSKFESGRQTTSRCMSCGYCALGSIDGPTRCHFGKLDRAVAGERGRRDQATAPVPGFVEHSR
jgi:2,4-dienoyl-CoA reductase-like NADH-dependent reductase (Old Yellow Enzyme family)